MSQPELDRVTDACNAFLETLGPTKTVEILRRYVTRPTEEGVARDAEFFDLQVELLGHPEARRRFIGDLSGLADESGLTASHPSLAAKLSGKL